MLATITLGNTLAHGALIAAAWMIGIQADDWGKGLPLAPLRNLIKEYFVVCESYFAAIKTASPSRIETIDMGRHGLHNEGAEILVERLADSLSMDTNTARRLFTLVCVLHIKG